MSGLSLTVKCQEQKYRAVEVIFAPIHKKTLTVDFPTCFDTGDNDKKVPYGQCFPFFLAMSILTVE